MNTFTLEGHKRETTGTKASRALRREGKVPCVLYGGEENVHFHVSQMQVRDLVYSPNFYKVNLSVDGVSREVILKDLQFNPVTDRLEHLDFLELDENRAVMVDLPIEFTGQAPGVREGGALIPKLRRLRVKALPKHLIDKVEVDVSELVLGKSIKVNSIELEDIEIMTSLKLPVASVEIPRVLRSEQAEEEEAAAAAAEGEGEGEAPAEGAEEGGDEK